MTEPKRRYVLYQRLARGQIDSYLALAPAGGRVMVHLAEEEPADALLRLLDGLDRLPPEDRARIRVVDSVDGSPVIVTDNLPGFESLPQWLDARLSDAPTTAPDVPDAAITSPDPSVEGPGDAGGPERSSIDADRNGAASDSEPGEFTRLFLLGQGASSSQAGPRPTRRTAEEGPAERDPVPTATEDGSGERDAAEVRDTSVEPDPSDGEPGAFTQQFLLQSKREGEPEAAEGALPAEEDPASEPVPAPMDEGPPSEDFEPRMDETDAMDAAGGASGVPDVPEARLTDPGASAPARPDTDAGYRADAAESESSGSSRTDSGAEDGPGEFTRSFSAQPAESEGGVEAPGWDDSVDLGDWGPGEAESGDSPALDESADDYLERLGADPGADDDFQSAPEAPPPGDLEPPPAPPPGPSRYTEILRGGGPRDESAPAATESPAFSPPVAPPPPPSKRRYVIALVVIALLALGLILFLALRGRAADSEADTAGDGENAAIRLVTPTEAG